MYLAVDIGGTKVRVALVSDDLQVSHAKRYQSDEFDGLEKILEDYLDLHKVAIKAISIGVAGPVVNGQVRLTNLDWLLDQIELSKNLNGKPVYLLNDLEAFGWGISKLDDKAFRVLNKGHNKLGNQALIAAGTGLGESVLVFDGRHHRPFPSEGSHADFGPPEKQDADFSRWLFNHYDHVSWERVVSGSFGFRNLYLYLKQTDQYQKDPDLDGKVDASDFGRFIMEAADMGSKIAEQVMLRFCRYYGAEAGNLALKSMAIGGVYVAGGIAPKILKWLEKGTFVEGFVEKGRFKGLLKEVPVKVVVDDDCALKGAANYALQQLG